MKIKELSLSGKLPFYEHPKINAFKFFGRRSKVMKVSVTLPFNTKFLPKNSYNHPAGNKAFARAPVRQMQYWL
jgi:hypothetical protein